MKFKEYIYSRGRIKGNGGEKGVHKNVGKEEIKTSFIHSPNGKEY